MRVSYLVFHANRLAMFEHSFGFVVYSCHGSWVENDTTFIIARHAGSQHGVCISFLPQEGTAAKLVVGDTCKRSNLPQSDHHLTANLTVYGKNANRNMFFEKS